jgi:S1-C subfamily serine protease
MTLADDPNIALVQAERTGLPPAKFQNELPIVGELAVVIGSPLGFENSVTAGVISGPHRSIPGSAAQTQSLVDMVQTDAPISPGNSGGAVLDADGDPGTTVTVSVRGSDGTTRNASMTLTDQPAVSQ